MSPRLLLACVLLLAPRAVPAGDEALAALDAVFETWDRADSPGMAVAVIHKGRIIYERGFGMADIEAGVTITPDTIFRIGSTSKQFTAMCLALLAERGDLDLDADIRVVLPELAPQDPPVHFRHLVHHTSGIPDYVDLHLADGVSEEDPLGSEQSYERLCAVTELDFAPGSQHAYSNSNYFLMSIIVQRLTDQTLRQFAEANIFEPLGMAHTHYHDRHDEPVDGRANGYSPGADGDGWRVHNTVWDHVGDGGVFTTVRDMARWDAIFYANPLPGGDELIAKLLTPGVLDDGTPLTYAFGLNVASERGRRCVSHGGGWVGFRAEMVRYPESELSVVVLSNCATANPSALARKLASLLLGKSG